MSTTLTNEVLKTLEEERMINLFNAANSGDSRLAKKIAKEIFDDCLKEEKPITHFYGLFVLLFINCDNLNIINDIFFDLCNKKKTLASLLANIPHVIGYLKDGEKYEEMWKLPKPMRDGVRETCDKIKKDKKLRDLPTN
jgi:hypothetical protein